MGVASSHDCNLIFSGCSRTNYVYGPNWDAFLGERGADQDKEVEGLVPESGLKWLRW